MKKTLVNFRQSGKNLEWDSQFPNLLEFAESNGVDICNCCRQGIDLVCETRLLKGKVRYTSANISEVINNECILPCVCVPDGDIEIDA